MQQIGNLFRNNERDKRDERDKREVAISIVVRVIALKTTSSRGAIATWGSIVVK